MNTDINKKVAVALSGGIDSSVTCALLKKQGYNVIAVTAKMTNSPSFEIVCQNAKSVADKLEIEHYILNLENDFQKEVIDYFEDSYQKGITPNPCVVCNKKIKWGKLFDYAINELNCDYIATGHYAKIIKNDDKYLLYPAQDEKKDQLYYLVALTQKHLSKTLFPLSNYTKDEIRQMAQNLDLPTKSAKESQDICFIEKPMTTKKWLIEKFKEQKGNFILQKTGEKIGTHQGFYQYTIGQRKGIGIAYSEPLYVTGLDASKNIVYLGVKSELFANECIIENVNIQDNIPNDGKVMAKIRYNMPAFLANAQFENDTIKLKFDTPQSAVTSGQIGALYDVNDGHLLAGGWIK